jgi:hypothetical protein
MKFLMVAATLFLLTLFGSGDIKKEFTRANRKHQSMLLQRPRNVVSKERRKSVEVNNLVPNAPSRSRSRSRDNDPILERYKARRNSRTKGGHLTETDTEKPIEPPVKVINTELIAKFKYMLGIWIRDIIDHNIWLEKRKMRLSEESFELMKRMQEYTPIQGFGEQAKKVEDEVNIFKQQYREMDLQQRQAKFLAILNDEDD